MGSGCPPCFLTLLSMLLTPCSVRSSILVRIRTLWFRLNSDEKRIVKITLLYDGGDVFSWSIGIRQNFSPTVIHFRLNSYRDLLHYHINVHSIQRSLGWTSMTIIFIYGILVTRPGIGYGKLVTRCHFSGVPHCHCRCRDALIVTTALPPVYLAYGTTLPLPRSRYTTLHRYHVIPCYHSWFHTVEWAILETWIRLVAINVMEVSTDVITLQFDGLWNKLENVNHYIL